MSWRTIQLGEKLCDQDQVILDLFCDKSVRYIGTDSEFIRHLTVDTNSSKAIIIINQNIWLSDLIKQITQELTKVHTDEFYIGINRYVISGNDTTKTFNGHGGHCLLEFITEQLESLGFYVTKSGLLDNDRGRYFNFVQPLTWVYGTNKNN